MILNDLAKNNQVYIACGYTDMRKSIDGLSALVQQNFQLDPFQPSLFLFCGKKTDRIKALLWEDDLFISDWKAAAFNGQSEKEVMKITQQELRWLLECLSIDHPKAVKMVKIDTVI